MLLLNYSVVNFFIFTLLYLYLLQFCLFFKANSFLTVITVYTYIFSFLVYFSFWKLEGRLSEERVNQGTGLMPCYIDASAGFFSFCIGITPKPFFDFEWYCSFSVVAAFILLWVIRSWRVLLVWSVLAAVAYLLLIKLLFVVKGFGSVFTQVEMLLFSPLEQFESENSFFFINFIHCINP